MKGIPEKIRIGGIDYTVHLEEKLISEDGRALYGQIRYEDAIIKLEPKIQDIQGVKQTLWHEILHGVAKHFDLKINEDEDAIDKLAKGIYMVCVDNPQLFASGESQTAKEITR